MSSEPTRRESALCEPQRNTANSFSKRLAPSGIPAASIPPAAYNSSIDPGSTSIVVQPMDRVSIVRPIGKWVTAVRPRWAALMRNAASFDTSVVGAELAWPSAAPIIRLSGFSGSIECSMRMCFWTPFNSIRTVPPSVPTGTGAAIDPPAEFRRSSIARNAARAARPASSGRVFSPSSSSITMSGMTMSESA